MASQREVVLCLAVLSEGVARPGEARAEWYEARDPESVADDVLARVTSIITRSRVVLDAGVLARMPRLRRVVRAGSGVDNIDVAELDRRGIELVRSPVVSAPAVAELASAGLTLLARRVPAAHALVQRGEIREPGWLGDSTADLDVVIWGAGPVGRACARCMEPRVRRVRFVRYPSVPDGVANVPASAALVEADAHILALPLLPHTAGLVGDRWLRAAAAQRPYLLNVARTGLVSWPALSQALADDGLRGVFLEPVDPADVSEASALVRRHPRANLLVSQHLGAQRTDIRAELDEWAVSKSLATTVTSAG